MGIFFILVEIKDIFLELNMLNKVKCLKFLIFLYIGDKNYM